MSSGTESHSVPPARTARRLWLGLLIWLTVTMAVTAILWFFRGTLDKAHMALGFLLVVLAGSTREGRVVGLVLSAVCFLAFNFFLLSPFYTFAIQEPLDWWVLIAFLITSLVAAQMFHRAQRAVVLAERVEALKESDRLKDALLASVSHDLRTPLTSIRAIATELRETGDERAAIIEGEADRLNRMVTDLLDLSRIRAGALPVDPQVNAAEDLVGAALSQLRGVVGDERIQVQLPGDGTMLLGRFDFVQALRALANLLENAIRHSPPEGRVDIQLALDGADLVIRVMDRGPGVSEEIRDRMFEAFFRPKDGSLNPKGGAGLGLTIARSVAEVQGGSVTYFPRSGGGSVFELRLPAADFDEIP
ncbi:MAG: ATP-binding protein [Longimicrobiales bacterium]|nr:ATP-binding protein [Longimicrobiales bacterium]